jgi:hypothetical protein
MRGQSNPISLREVDVAVHSVRRQQDRPAGGSTCRQTPPIQNGAYYAANHLTSDVHVLSPYYSDQAALVGCWINGMWPRT